MIAASRAELALALTGLYDDYGAAIDDDFARWPDYFTEDAVYRVVARENYARGLLWPTMSCEGRGMMLDRVNALRDTTLYAPRQMRHFASAIRVLEDLPDGYRVRANFLVAESLTESASRVFAVGRSYDTIVRVAADGGERLLFRERTCVYDGDLIQSSLVYPL